MKRFKNMHKTQAVRNQVRHQTHHNGAVTNKKLAAKADRELKEALKFQAVSFNSIRTFWTPYFW